jgi:hypothetical protein
MSEELLFSDDLDQHPLSAPAVELTVEDLLPRPEIQPASGDGHHDLAAYHLPLQVCVGVVLASAVMPVLVGGRVRGETLEPFLVIVVQAALVIVDQNNTIVSHCLLY